MSRKEELAQTLKHAVYRGYSECWMAKICQTFPRAAIVDSFAGAGRYSDGLAGSPVLVAEAFVQHTSYKRFKKLDLVLQEARGDRVDELRRQMAEFDGDPRLTLLIQHAGEHSARQAALSALAHGDRADTPVLWILDPYDLKTLPFSDVATAFRSGPRDEVISTFFVDEVYRFCNKPDWAGTLNRYFGGDHWRKALEERTEGGRKLALVNTYKEGLQELGAHTGSFGVRVRNEAARYELVYATHSEFGLKCWNPVGWRLDPLTGRGSTVQNAGAMTLFDEAPGVSPLRAALDALQGTEVRWAQLVSIALRTNHTEAQLRQTLSDMAYEGLAVRVAPGMAKTDWPEGSTVRFYSLEAATDEPEDAGS
jgi:three-Cys-motif partner protein